jgi:mannose-6-phosphate isomerase-like protein (cupin superfamily)
MYGVFDVFRPTLEVLSSPEEEIEAGYCVMKETIPAGVEVPLHSHPDAECFFTVSGTVQVLSQKEGLFEWLDVKPGNFIQVPCGAKHAFRNKSSEPVVQIVVSIPTLGRFFREVGKRVTPGAPPLPPTPEELRHFVRVADKYQYWMGTPEENAAIGISLFQGQ